MLETSPNTDCSSYFTKPSSSVHKQYLALRRFFADGFTAEQVAKETGYSKNTVYSMVRDFRKKLNSSDLEDPFFKEIKTGRKHSDYKGEVEEAVINLRKKYFSVPDIQIAMDALGVRLTIYAIEKIIIDAGFARMPRRDKQFRSEVISSCEHKLVAPIACRFAPAADGFTTQLAGLLCVLPTIVKYGIDKIIDVSAYPETKEIRRMSSILSFVALKLSNVRRYSADDAWCMDRGLGLFAGLNVLPKAAWFSSYSSAITRDMNVSFLKGLQSVWIKNSLLSDTVNLDFTAIPYWGDDDPFENNWSGKRGRALASIQAVLAQDPESGLLCYGDTTVRHDRQDNVVLEFMDFYHSEKQADKQLKYLVFDSKFTTYQNLSKLNGKGIKFVTIRRRSKTLVSRIQGIDDSQWKKIKVEKANGKSRTVTVCEETDCNIKDYDGTIRQIYIKDNGRTKPAIIMTNDLKISLKDLVRKYSSRWLVETEIAEQIDFFHLNRNSSGIVVKVDFDLTMTILAHNLYRLFCKDFEGYSHCNAQTIYDKFTSASGEIDIDEGVISVKLKRKRSLPILLERMNAFKHMSYSWLENNKVTFSADSTT
jgi:transposase